MATLVPMSGPIKVDQPNVGTIRYGLFSAAGGPLDLPAHGSLGGVYYDQEHCGQGHLWPSASCGTASSNKPMDACDGAALGMPFQVIASLQMGAFPWSEAEFTRRVRVRLQDNAQQIAEQAFWGGTADVGDVLRGTPSPNFTNKGFTLTDKTPTPGTPVPLEYGVAILEDNLANYGYPGIIHARPIVSPFATERLLAIADGKPGTANNKYRSPMGNVWSFGRGYSGLNPSDGSAIPGPPTAPSVANAYLVGTGPVTVFRDPTVYVNPIFRTMDRTGNQLLAVAEQAYAMTVECVAYFVLVSLVGM